MRRGKKPATRDYFNKQQNGLSSWCKVCINISGIKRKKLWRIKLRNAVFDHYGWACVICGENNPLFLTVDHINGRGKRHRKKLGGKEFYLWLAENNFPPEFRTLCFNCNCRGDNSEPTHFKNRKAKYDWNYRKNLRSLIISHYGGRCECCGESNINLLTIDHINGGGRKQCDKIGSLGFYRWLVKNDFPLEFRILCHNCNSGTYLNNGICPHKTERNKKCKPVNSIY